jgi:hypothetical protein
MRVIRSVSSVENRFPPTILPRWRTDDEFRQLLASFEKIIPLKYPSDLQGSTTLTAKLLTRSEGTIGELKDAPRRGGNGRDAQRNGTKACKSYSYTIVIQFVITLYLYDVIIASCFYPIMLLRTAIRDAVGFFQNIHNLSI